MEADDNVGRVAGRNEMQCVTSLKTSGMRRISVRLPMFRSVSLPFFLIQQPTAQLIHLPLQLL